ncbi:hypothetical protein CHLV4142_09290 [Campylobacter helveticus]|uniref:Uncharacterized protein n=1 Tax=Campylobacter helveticus TaxID=28898 RepID=A0ABY3KZW3_9BACT|nr:hypothetical protein [Campylobacter helveticus]MCR2040334.1 hypothetical protein [Campylobacter helveticus]TXK56171.1 hypothetical protein FVD16_08390 [Campylobacter helveticus]
MAFKQAPKNNDFKKLQEDKFIEQARGETNNEETKPKLKPLNVPLPIETINLLKNYQQTEGKKNRNAKLYCQ